MFVQDYLRVQLVFLTYCVKYSIFSYHINPSDVFLLNFFDRNVLITMWWRDDEI